MKTLNFEGPIVSGSQPRHARRNADRHYHPFGACIESKNAVMIEDGRRLLGY
jgi:hypothetical protein